MTDTSDTRIRSILSRTRRIAMIGASPKPERPSHGVMRFLLNAGYDVIPVNPGHAGETLLGQTVVADMESIEGDVDMIDIFRASEHVPGVVDAALARFPDLDTIWMQLGVVHEDAAETARARGVEVVMDRCPKIEHARLMA